MNNVFLIGRLTRNPEKHQTQSGKSVTSFSLAVDRPGRKSESGGPTADFIPVIAWNKLADIVAQYLEKGRKICVEGRIQTRSYKAKDGTARHVVEVVAGGIEFMDNPKKSAAEESGLMGRAVSDEEIPF